MASTKHTGVIIVGNGPSAISLSYLLAGNCPYYNGGKKTDGVEEFLHYKLMDNIEKPLLEQDLEFLCEGLEGRSPNPVAILFDTLSHPGADSGLNQPSALSWKRNSDKHIPHVVLGSGSPGGSWQSMEGCWQTISLSNWMQMPNLPIRTWISNRKERTQDEFAASQRAAISDVRDYYVDYVKLMKMEKYFQNHSIVTSVRLVQSNVFINCENGETEIDENENGCRPQWEVRGVHTLTNINGGITETEQFCIQAPYVVLATGTHDLSNKLNIQGEDLPFVSQSLTHIENLHEEICPHRNPVVIVGSGLSAADAILLARANSLPIIHVYRKEKDDPSLIFKKLPKVLYPEYHDVYELMQGNCYNDALWYTSFPSHEVKEIRDNQTVVLKDVKTMHETTVGCSRVLVLIGSRPNLFYLEDEGRFLGNIPGAKIDCHYNPVSVDEYSYQSTQTSGLFAMGPLVADNFVRFVQGGSLGIASHLWKTCCEL